MLKKYLPIALILSLACMVMACEEDIVLNLDDEDVAVVFEGDITDEAGPYQISLTETVGYFSETGNPPAVGALMVISDDAGNVDTLTEVSPGIYETNTLQGVQLRTYSLYTEYNGEVYESEYTMPRLDLGDDSLRYEFIPESFLFEEGYYVYATGTEPAGVGDYYKFTLSVNDSLYDAPEDLFFFDDEFVDGVDYDFLFPYPLEVGDTAVISAVAITQVEYDFLVTLIQEIFVAGSPFGSPPANLSNNITNGGLGFFAAHGVARDTVVIQ